MTRNTASVLHYGSGGWLFLFFPSITPFFPVIDGDPAVCGMQRLTKCKDQIGNQSSHHCWQCAWTSQLPPMEGTREGGGSSCCRLSPRNCFGFHFYFSQEERSWRGQPRQQKKDKEKLGEDWNAHGEMQMPQGRGKPYTEEGSFGNLPFFVLSAGLNLVSCVFARCPSFFLRGTVCDP